MTGGQLNIDTPGGFWFFAYGSLMWDPPFPVAEARSARLYGWHRSFCVRSETYRGTPERPGLSLGLDRGGSCAGLALRVGDAERDIAIRAIEKREMDDDQIYICRPVRLHLPGGRIDGYTLVVDRGDRIYAGRQDFEQTARTIATATGARGPNVDYLANTVAHLDEMGIAEGHLHALLRRVREIGNPG